MQMARRHLFSLASSTAWRRLLGLYERAEYERYRFFDIANGGMALREHPLTGIDQMCIRDRSEITRDGEGFTEHMDTVHTVDPLDRMPELRTLAREAAANSTFGASSASTFSRLIESAMRLLAHSTSVSFGR